MQLQCWVFSCPAPCCFNRKCTYIDSIHGHTSLKIRCVLSHFKATETNGTTDQLKSGLKSMMHYFCCCWYCCLKITSVICTFRWVNNVTMSIQYPLLITLTGMWSSTQTCQIFKIKDYSFIKMLHRLLL